MWAEAKKDPKAACECFGTVYRSLHPKVQPKEIPVVTRAQLEREDQAWRL